MKLQIQLNSRVSGMFLFKGSMRKGICNCFPLFKLGILGKAVLPVPQCLYHEVF